MMTIIVTLKEAKGHFTGELGVAKPEGEEPTALERKVCYQMVEAINAKMDEFRTDMAGAIKSVTIIEQIIDPNYGPNPDTPKDRR